MERFGSCQTGGNRDTFKPQSKVSYQWQQLQSVIDSPEVETSDWKKRWYSLFSKKCSRQKDNKTTKLVCWDQPWSKVVHPVYQPPMIELSSEACCRLICSLMLEAWASSIKPVHRGCIARSLDHHCGLLWNLERRHGVRLVVEVYIKWGHTVDINPGTVLSYVMSMKTDPIPLTQSMAVSVLRESL